jgi:hypothetical protein
MTPRPSAERYQRLGATIRAHVDQARNLSSAVDELRFIELPSIYRRNAICMRVILPEGRVKIFNLAKNAGTSVDQIERFYARNLPLSREMAKNLQSFGSG